MVGTLLGWAQLRSDSRDIEINNPVKGFEVVAETGGVGVQPTLLGLADENVVTVNEVLASRFEGGNSPSLMVVIRR